MEVLDIYYGLEALWKKSLHDTKKALNHNVLRKLYLE